MFIDTSSLMHPNARQVILTELAPKLQSNGNKLIVLDRVVGELEKHRAAIHPGAEEKVAAATRGYELLLELTRLGLLEVKGADAPQPFADQLFKTVFTFHMTRHPLTLITQDISLMVDILGLQESKAIQYIKPIAVVTITPQGLHPVSPEEAEFRYQRKMARLRGTPPPSQPGAQPMGQPYGQPAGQPVGLPAARPTAVPLRPPQPKAPQGWETLTEGPQEPEPEQQATVRQPFAPPMVVYQMPDRPRAMSEALMPVTLDLETGSVLTGSKGVQYRLGRCLGEGGEGEVYETSNPKLVAKLYFPSHLTRGRLEKLLLMVQRGLDWKHPDAEGICWPTDLLIDAQGKFRGYVMPKAKGKTLNTIFIRPELERHFPQWTRLDLGELCVAVLKKIRFLHASGVLIGDINPRNFLITSEKEISLVDCDSYQVEGYPCPVGDVQFTPPELQGLDFSKVLRRPENEAFAVSTLLFMILHVGKPPYAQVDGGTPAENIRNMHFPYTVGDRKGSKIPPGPYRDIFSNLTRKVKDGFLQTFDKEHKDQPRLSVEEWLYLMEGYAHAIRQGWVSGDLFPEGAKQLTVEDCVRMGIPFRAILCKDCGGDFVLLQKDEERMIREGRMLPDLCPDCRKARVARRQTGGGGTAYRVTGAHTRTAPSPALGHQTAQPVPSWRPPGQAPAPQQRATAPVRSTAGQRPMPPRTPQPQPPVVQTNPNGEGLLQSLLRSLFGKK